MAAFSLLWCSSCTSSKPYPTYAQRTTTANDNNVVVVKGKRPPWMQRKGSAQVIFQGKNNLLQVMLNKQAMPSGGNQVIVIKGNGNTIKIDSADVANARFMRSANGDTLVIMGNQQRYVVKNGQIVVPPNPKGAQSNTLKIRTTPFQKSRYLPDFKTQMEGGHKAHFHYFNGLREIKFALNYFVGKIEQEGDPESYFELAEMYRSGTGTYICLKKAAELYEYAAVKQHKLAIRRLGDFYHHGVALKRTIFPGGKKSKEEIYCNSIQKNKALAKFYYAQGSQLGDLYCTAMLNEID
ncbi:MAG TPA: hypothetical protein DCS93_09165 [Microscillaceae bacterium]|nr:hypothetical protein [Microscillaceae bacterium]